MAYRNIDVNKIRRFSMEIFSSFGLSPQDCETVTDVLVTADLFGIESHGIQRLIRYYKNLCKNQVSIHPQMEIVAQTPVSATLDAHHALGHIAGKYAMELAIEKAKESGIGMVAVRNSSHFGIAGYYTTLTLPHRMIGIAATNTEQIGVPTYGRRPMIGTNPLAFSMPAHPYPFWYDAATTVVTHGKMEIYEKAGKRLPPEWAVDKNGGEESDPSQVRRRIRERQMGGILPLGGLGKLHGGHKGYGLALIVEICSSILSGGPTCIHMADGTGEEHTSHFFAAIDYGVFGDRQAMEDALSDYLQEIRDSETAAGCSRIYTHGEQAWLSREEKLRTGIPLQEATIQELEKIVQALNLASPFA